MKTLTVVGARPQFVKAAMVSRAIARHNGSNKDADAIEEILVHTGQHYDENLSRVFFDQLKIPLPKYNLAVGSGTHGSTTGRMLAGVEELLLKENADWVLVYGDTNSTLAGALAAAKLCIPIAHVEAGLRSFNRQMPEEINRVLTDHMASLLLCPTKVAVENLKTEGIVAGIHHVGDVMYDAALVFGKLADKESTVLSDLSVSPGSYLLATVHRAENTDDPSRLRSIFSAFADLATQSLPVVVPLHPRTSACVAQHGLDRLIAANPTVRLIEPVSFLDMVMLEKNAQVILTDSGGVQKEAYFHSVPCVTLRDETEWLETVKAGWNQVVGVDRDNILAAVESAASLPKHQITEYADGHSAEAMVRLLAVGN